MVTFKTASVTAATNVVVEAVVALTAVVETDTATAVPVTAAAAAAAAAAEEEEEEEKDYHIPKTPLA